MAGARHVVDSRERPLESRLDLPEHAMNPFSKTNLPMTLVIVLAVWAWVSFISVILGSLF